jgi:hypothetical protein
MIAFALLVPLAVLGAVIAGIAALAKRNEEEPPDGFVRRIVVSGLTFGMTIVLALGVFNLLDIAFSSFDDEIFRSGSADMARALAMTIVGGPAAFALWRYQLRVLSGPDGRSIVWLLHQAFASATFSTGTVVALGNGIRPTDFDSSARSSLAFAVAWGAAWLFHEWVRGRHPAPILPGLAQAIAGGVGLITLAYGGVALLAAIFAQIEPDVIASSGRPIVSAIVWLAIGAGVWAWQFLTAPSLDRWSRVGLVLGLGVGGGALLALGGATLFATLLLGTITDGLEWEEIGAALGAVAVGSLIWRYHHGLSRDLEERRVGRHLVSGLSLIGLAVGIGVLVNYGLAALTPAFAARNEDELLWTGLAAVLVNGPVWWFTWRPDRRPDPDTGTVVQRTYLTVLGGVAGVVGAIALIYLAFQLIEGILDGDSAGTIVDAIRAPLGFVVATAGVTGYHYRRWAASRVHEEAQASVTVERVTLVGPGEVADSLRHDLGVRVTRWASAGEGRVLGAGDLAQHLRDLDATDVLVVEEDGGFRVVRLLRSDAQRLHTGPPQE